MKITVQGRGFDIGEMEAANDSEVVLTVNACKHVIQDGAWSRNPDGSLTDPELAKLGEIVAEDHLEFCLGVKVVPELEGAMNPELWGEA